MIIGTFAAPLAQWLVFFIVARAGGSADAGAFALLFAVATPVATATNWGLRNGYITLLRRAPFMDFLILRVVGVLLATGLITAFGVYARLDPLMVTAVAIMKAADSITDIWYGRWQRQQRLLPFGSLMIVNGVTTAGYAAIFGLLGFSSAWIVFGSTLGSLTTLLAAWAVDLREIAVRFHRGFDWSGAHERQRRVLIDCWQICAGQILAGLVVNLPTWTVALFGSSADIGRFASAAYMITAGSLVGASLNSVVLGKYHASMMSGGISSVQRSAQRTSLAITTFGMVATLIIGLVGVQVFQLIYGPGFYFTPLELSLVALSAALNPGTYLMNAALLSANSYTAQMSIVGIALVGSAAVAGLAAFAQLTGLLVGACAALAGSLLKYALSSWWLRRLVHNSSPMPTP